MPFKTRTTDEVGQLEAILNNRFLEAKRKLYVLKSTRFREAYEAGDSHQKFLLLQALEQGSKEDVAALIRRILGDYTIMELRQFCRTFNIKNYQDLRKSEMKQELAVVDPGSLLANLTNIEDTCRNTILKCGIDIAAYVKFFKEGRKLHGFRLFLFHQWAAGLLRIVADRVPIEDIKTYWYTRFKVDQ